jgi:hypothetical protein
MAADPFDFDYWCDLASRDPAAFFAEREGAIDDYISAHPEAERGLRALQVRIDEMRALSGTPVNAIAGLAAMMAQATSTLSIQLVALSTELNGCKSET